MEFSPTDQGNMEILKFLVIFHKRLYRRLELLYEKSYKKFDKFKRVFYDDFGGINYHEYINLVKNYVDKSIFDKIEKLCKIN